MSSGVTAETKQFKALVEIGSGFYNLRAPFYVLGGCLDVGTHMSLCKLSNGNFLVLDTTPIKPKDISTIAKQEIDTLTNNGALIEAVIASHPYHTIYFESFYKLYPSTHIKWYGTTRHIENIKAVPWETASTDIIQPHSPILDKWQDQGVSMRIPEGAEFINPGHFSSVFVFHHPSKTLHVDDTLQYFDDKAGFVLNSLIFGLLRTPRGSIILHSSTYNDASDSGLYNTEQAADQFKAWLTKVCDDWDFENICTAHKGNLIGGAKEAVRRALVANENQFLKYSFKNKGK